VKIAEVARCVLGYIDDVDVAADVEIRFLVERCNWLT
jgi:hypothetical protein